MDFHEIIGIGWTWHKEHLAKPSYTWLHCFALLKLGNGRGLRFLVFIVVYWIVGFMRWSCWIKLYFSPICSGNWILRKFFARLKHDYRDNIFNEIFINKIGVDEFGAKYIHFMFALISMA